MPGSPGHGKPSPADRHSAERPARARAHAAGRRRAWRMPERFHDWTLRQRAIYRKLWLEEVMSQLGPGPGSGVYRRIWLEEVMAQLGPGPGPGDEP